MSRKVALITGVCAQNMIAYSVASEFAKAGYDLVITGRNNGRLTQAAKELSAEYDVEALPLHLAVDRQIGEEAVAKVVEQAVERYGRIDVLVNASQAAKVGDTLDKVKMADLAAAMDTGVTAVFLLMRACYHQLKEAKGTVINLTSAGAEQGQPGFTVLAASKEATRGISAVAANEWERDGISVFCIAPRVRTAAFEKWAQEYPEAAKEFGDLESLESFGKKCLALA